MTARIGWVGVVCLLFVLSAATVRAEGAKQHSANSVIVEVVGEACLGQEHSRSQTMKLALAEAKRIAAEMVLSHVTSQTSVKNGALEEDLISAYSKAKVRVIKELEKGWYMVDGSGGFVDSCYRVKISAEVIPAKVARPEKVIQATINNPKAPLTVELWTDRDIYNLGQTMTFYIRGNKPFYARAVYKDAHGNLIEITPNGAARYYKGGVTYAIPGDSDTFTLRIEPPLGKERLTLYASTHPMGSYKGQKAGDLFVVKRGQDMSMTTRGLAILHGAKASSSGKAEFAEVSVDVKVEE